MFYRASSGIQWLLLKVSDFQPATLLRKRLRKRCFAVNFAKSLEHLFFWQNTSGWLLLVFICEFWDIFQNTSFKEHLGETAILCTSCRISTTNTIKNYFTGAFQAFYTKSRSNHSKAFIYLKSQKTVCEGVNLLWSCKMLRGRCQPAS